MKFITIALLALIAISAVSADNEEITKCIMDLKQPCVLTDTACVAEFSKFGQCISTNSCLTKAENLSDFASCVSNCKSTNSDVQSYIDKYVDCINANILSFTLVLLAIFAFMF